MMKRTIAICIIFVLLVVALFITIFSIDNKYNGAPPYGGYGVISLTEQDMERPVFLIDGWEFTNQSDDQSYTYIGEYSNLQHGNPETSPHGTATYSLTLDYVGRPQEVMVYFPALFFDYTLWLDGQLLGQGQGSNRSSFTLTEGSHTMVVETTSTTGYYSGLYHPPALGATQVISGMVFVQIAVYALACFGSLVLALFTLPLWLRKKDPLALWFGLLCLSLPLYLSYFFVRLFGLPFGEYWYLMQSLSFYGLCFCVFKLVVHTCGKEYNYQIWVERFILSFSGVLTILAVIIPWWDGATGLHGLLTDVYCLILFCTVAWFALSAKVHNSEQIFAKLACIIFGTGLLYNLFASNLFEPIYTLWQFEWCGLLLVVLFGCGMVSRNRRILAENEAYRENLEIMVAERTRDLTEVLKVRKAFFADMAHDLKAPVYATASFIDAIRANSTGVDSELLRYLDLVEQKQKEMASRVQGLSEFNRMDGLSEQREPIELTALLTRIQTAHQMAAQVQMVHFVVEPPMQAGTLYAPLGKLDILFENLIFNALKFTPPEGKITLSASVDEQGYHFALADTGCGIPPEEIPRLFDRFYVGKQGKEKGGSGLGLYIVKSIVDSLGGELSISSKVGQGTVFLIDLPLKA